MVSDHYRDKWPGPIMPLVPFTPGEPFIPYKPEKSDDIDIQKIFDKIGIKRDDPPAIRMITAEQWLEYQELKRKAAEYDRITSQPDCVKPDVDAWEQDIEAFLILMGLLTEEDIWQKEFRAGVGG
jgi:hypothetical protein